uniref:TTF-type domain-containing protein n=1 Tax=Fagus sylvatica TaxID=28930 RepID=A0A2N9H031_FAGSY
MLKYTASINESIVEVILENAPGNAKYTSPDIQKEILNILAIRVRNKIREEIGDAKFCILVDEALDESNKEQMAIVLRFVNRDGFVQERFFDVVGVDETSAKTLKKGICNVLTHHNLQVENMRGQGYDGASNMRGVWNGLQALFLKNCPYAYYEHCFAHQLQLALVAAAKDVPDVWKFFSKLNSIVNLVGVSPKRHMELKNIKAAELADMLASGELATDNRFTERTTILLVFSLALNPVDGFKSFKIDDICSLASEFYPGDFTQVEMGNLRRQLKLYEHDVFHNSKFQNLTSLSELCRRLVETGKVSIYFLIDRLVRLVLTLPVSMATTERAFSAMKLVKTTLRNKMEDGFLADCLVIYIERELARNIDSDSIINDFYSIKNRRAPLK